MSLISRTLRSEILRLPVGRSSRNYNFISWKPPGTLLRNWADEFENLEAILFMADLAICNSHSAHHALVDKFDKILQNFRRVCTFPWLAKKDIILVILNIEDQLNKPLHTS